MSSWKTLGNTNSTALVDARLQAHHAAQVVAAIGATFLPPAADDSHPNLGWDDSRQALVSRAIPETADLRVGLRIEALVLEVFDTNGRNDEIPLAGLSIAEASQQLETALATHNVKPPNGKLSTPGYEIPDHAVTHGEKFNSTNTAPFAELARWFANGHDALSQLSVSHAGGAEVRCWPHHFDLGGLFVVSTGAGGELTSSVGFGLSPGDDSYAEPYAYVSPWPAPDASTLPVVDGSHWHTQGFTSAILTGTELMAGGTDDTQETRLQRFLSDAFTASRSVFT